MMKSKLLFSTAVVLACHATPAFAQDAADEALPGDIVVTATREETVLSKTPLAVTAITSEGLRDAGITDARGLMPVSD